MDWEVIAVENHCSPPMSMSINRQHRSVDESKFELVRGHDDDDDDGAAAAGSASAGAVTGRHPKPDFSPHGFRQCHTRVSSVVSSRVDRVSLYGAVRYRTTDDNLYYVCGGVSVVLGRGYGASLSYSDYRSGLSLHTVV